MVRNANPAKTARRLGAALVLLTLAACAGDRENRAVPLGMVQLADVASIEGRRDAELRGDSGETLALSHWPATTERRGVILAVHGYGDYGLSTYDIAAREWADRGIDVYAYDQRGFGRNPSNSVWPGAGRLIDDLAAVHALVRADAGGLPVTVVGHSMGGAVVAAAMGEGRIAPDRAVLLAPALWGGRYLNLGYRTLAATAALLFPDKRWSGDGVVRIQASDNIEALRALGRDPLYVRKPSSREFAGLIALMDRAVESAPGVTAPTLVLYGAKDQVVPETPLRETAARFSGPSEFRRVEDGWHLLLRDLGGKAVRDAVAAHALGAGV